MAITPTTSITEVPAEWFELHWQDTNGTEMMVFTHRSREYLISRYQESMVAGRCQWDWFITRNCLVYTSNQYRIVAEIVDGGSAFPEAKF